MYTFNPINIQFLDPDASEADKNELMPAEMYVPNQEQWLELRALKRKSFFLHPICCEKQ